MAIKRYYMKMNPDQSKGGVFKVDIVDRPAIEVNTFYFADQKESYRFSMSELAERGIITGPVLIPDQPIFRKQKLRKDGPVEEFECVFTADVIEQSMFKFMKDRNTDQVGLMHQSDKPVESLYVIECFMSDASRGIQAPKGYEDLPDRTWYMSGMIEDVNVREAVKAGKLRGWSIEGNYDLCEEMPTVASLSAAKLHDQIAAILRDKTSTR